LLAMSAATIDRALRNAPERAGVRPHRRAPRSAVIRRSVAVRTFDGWDDPPPAFIEADLVTHCGASVKGSFVQMRIPTKPPGYTERVPRTVPI
jgi:hypothetical protein